MTMTAVWWVVVPPADQGDGKNSQIVSTAIGSAQYDALNGGPDVFSGSSGTITLGGKPYVRYMGPFTSRAAAKSAKPESGSQYIGTLIGIGVGAGAEATTSPGNTSLPAAGGQAGGTAGAAASGPLAAIGNFVSALGSRNTWIRVAKVVIGGSLLIIGISRMAGVDNAVVRAGAKALPFV